MARSILPDIYFRTMETIAVYRKVPIGCVFAFAMMGIGCAPPPPRNTHDADVTTIKEGEVVWVRHWSVRDTERIVAHYAEDASLMLPRTPPANGKEAIRELVKQMVQDAALQLTFEATRVEVAKSGELGFSEGIYSLTLTDAVSKLPSTDKGTYLTIYQKIYGAWRAARSVYTSSIAAGAER